MNKNIKEIYDVISYLRNKERTKHYVKEPILFLSVPFLAQLLTKREFRYKINNKKLATNQMQNQFCDHSSYKSDISAIFCAQLGLLL